jgi:hypothetical protein
MSFTDISIPQYSPSMDNELGQDNLYGFLGFYDPSSSNLRS